MIYLSRRFINIICIGQLAVLSCCTPAHYVQTDSNDLQSEPLRLIVPIFSGPEPLGKRVRTTIYFDLARAFRHSGSIDKGTWIIYGTDKLSEPSHDSAISKANMPSINADLVLWGHVYRFDDGVAVQLYLTITPVIMTRIKRPELWTIETTRANGELYYFEIDIPGRFYEFEPITLSNDVVMKYGQPEGIPFYTKRKGGKIRGYLGKMIHLKEINNDAILVESENKKGWVRISGIPEKKGGSISFVKGVVRMLRGDWIGAVNSFCDVLKNNDIPQSLRVYSLIYSGLAKEKIGRSGILEFEEAYRINKLDKDAAAYLLMGRISEVMRAEQRFDKKTTMSNIKKLKKEIELVKVLFPSNDEWIRNVEKYAR